MQSWAQKLNYIKNLKVFQKISFGLGWKTLAYLVLPIYWAIIITATFSL